MTAISTSVAVALALAALPGVVVPWLAIRALTRTRRSSALDVHNHRGILVAPVLGLVWPIWAAGLLVTQGVLDIASRLLASSAGEGGVLARVADTPLSLPLFGVPFLLVTGAFAFGLADDAFGSSGPKGFRGHLSALRQGVLTTGMLKMLGIGSIAVFYGASVAPSVLGRSALGGQAWSSPALTVVAWGLASAVIALSANLMNLLDVRPGRALKVYSALAPALAALFGLAVVGSYNADMASLAAQIDGVTLGSVEVAAVTVGMVAVVIGPALAVWSADLKERGMLGDSGANAAGAVLGYLLTAVLPLAGLAVVAAALLALNLLSERVSFSVLIERVPVLAWLDRLGGVDGAAGGQDASGEAVPRMREVRYHAHGDPTTRED